MVRNRNTTTRKWTQKDMTEALNGIAGEKFKMKDAVAHYGISRATLYRNLKKYSKAGKSFEVPTIGSPTILTKVEENVLEQVVKSLRKEGRFIGSKDIKRICFEYCDLNNISNNFNPNERLASNYWYCEFIKRHPTLNIMSGKQLGAKPSDEIAGGASSEVSGPNSALETADLANGISAEGSGLVDILAGKRVNIGMTNCEKCLTFFAPQVALKPKRTWFFNHNKDDKLETDPVDVFEFTES